MGRKEKKMLGINASPELCYVLWVIWLLTTFWMFSIFTLSAYWSARRKQWRVFAFYSAMHLVGIYNTITATANVSAWYNILAQLKGW